MPYPVTFLWWLQEVSWNVRLVWQLVFLGPISDRIKISTFVHRVEVDERFWTMTWRLIPNLTEHADVNSTHQLLAQDVKAMC
jgi:hypothetical protein